MRLGEGGGSGERKKDKAPQRVDPFTLKFKGSTAMVFDDEYRHELRIESICVAEGEAKVWMDKAPNDIQYVVK